MVKPKNSATGGFEIGQKEDLDDELLEDDDEGENGDGDYDSLTQAGLNVGKFLRSGEGDLDLGAGDAEPENEMSTIQKGLNDIYKVLTRTREKLDVEDNGGITEDVRCDFEEYKTHMEDITAGKDGGVFKRILQPGTGASSEMGKIVKFHYSSYVEGQDEPFDTSLLHGRTQKSKLGNSELIAGLELGLATMKEGELADFIMDHTYAYGVLGALPNIPPKCTILVTVRLVECIDEDPVDAMTMEQRLGLPFKEAVAYIERKLDQGKAQFGRGKFNAAINRYKDARVQAEMARKDWTEEENSTMTNFRIRLYKNLGKCYVKVSSPSKIMIYLKKLNEMGVNDSITRFLQAKVYFMKGEYDKAIDELRTARSLEPGNADINKFMAQVMKEKSDYDEQSKEQAKRMFSAMSSKGNGEGDTEQKNLK